MSLLSIVFWTNYVSLMSVHRFSFLMLRFLRRESQLGTNTLRAPAPRFLQVRPCFFLPSLCPPGFQPWRGESVPVNHLTCFPLMPVFPAQSSTERLSTQYPKVLTSASRREANCNRLLPCSTVPAPSNLPPWRLLLESLSLWGCFLRCHGFPRTALLCPTSIKEESIGAALCEPSSLRERLPLLNKGAYCRPGSFFLSIPDLFGVVETCSIHHSPKRWLRNHDSSFFPSRLFLSRTFIS